LEKREICNGYGGIKMDYGMKMFISIWIDVLGYG
jgi:hypothetical protein